MRFLFNKEKSEAKCKNTEQNILIDFCQKYYKIVQDRWVKKMSLITSDLSKSTLTYLFWLFVLVSVSLNIIIIVAGFSNTVSNSVEIIPLTKSVDINKKTLIINPGQGMLSEKELKRIFGFRSYLDSLRKTPLGKQRYDSILLYRPGLIDSLSFIENYYKSNIKD